MVQIAVGGKVPEHAMQVFLGVDETAVAIQVLSYSWRKNESARARRILLHAIDYLKNPTGYSRPKRMSVRHCSNKRRTFPVRHVWDGKQVAGGTFERGE